MKIKVDFVTNSSSASFTIALNDLSLIQIHAIYHHGDVVREQLKHNDFYINQYDEWNIHEEDGNLIGYTSMDNFDMLRFLTQILGIDRSKIKYERD